MATTAYIKFPNDPVDTLPESLEGQTTIVVLKAQIVSLFEDTSPLLATGKFLIVNDDEGNVAVTNAVVYIVNVIVQPDEADNNVVVYLNDASSTFRLVLS